MNVVGTDNALDGILLTNVALITTAKFKICDNFLHVWVVWGILVPLLPYHSDI